MKLFDGCLQKLCRLMDDYPVHSLQDKEAGVWPDEGRNQLIFKDDMAYELGGGNLPALSGIFLTDNMERVQGDEILLIGRDLPQLAADTPYARVVLVRVKTDVAATASEQYKLIRKLEYTRYHLNPKGFMMRISTLNQRECVRISKAALREGVDFAKVGEAFLKSYHSHPEVEAVKLIFITLPEFPFEELSDIMGYAENITKTLDHLQKKVQMDCNVCGLKQVCDEVEALYKKEFDAVTE